MTGSDDSGPDKAIESLKNRLEYIQDSEAEPRDGFVLFGTEMSVCECCGMAMIGTNPVCNDCKGSVPIAELERLADEWESLEPPEDHEGPFKATLDKGAREGITYAAEGLRELIAEYGGPDE